MMILTILLLATSLVSSSTCDGGWNACNTNCDKTCSSDTSIIAGCADNEGQCDYSYIPVGSRDMNTRQSECPSELQLTQDECESALYVSTNNQPFTFNSYNADPGFPKGCLVSLGIVSGQGSDSDLTPFKSFNLDTTDTANTNSMPVCKRPLGWTPLTKYKFGQICPTGYTVISYKLCQEYARTEFYKGPVQFLNDINAPKGCFIQTASRDIFWNSRPIAAITNESTHNSMLCGKYPRLSFEFIESDSKCTTGTHLTRDECNQFYVFWYGDDTQHRFFDVADEDKNFSPYGCSVNVNTYYNQHQESTADVDNGGQYICKVIIPESPTLPTPGFSSDSMTSCPASSRPYTINECKKYAISKSMNFYVETNEFYPKGCHSGRTVEADRDTGFSEIYYNNHPTGAAAAVANFQPLCTNDPEPTPIEDGSSDTGETTSEPESASGGDSSGTGTSGGDSSETDTDTVTSEEPSVACDVIECGECLTVENGDGTCTCTCAVAGDNFDDDDWSSDDDWSGDEIWVALEPNECVRYHDGCKTRDMECVAEDYSLCGEKPVYVECYTCIDQTVDQDPSYVGCYEDTGNRVFNFKDTSAETFTKETCAAACVGYAYYGLQYHGRECFCGLENEADNLDVPSIACGGQLGGHWALDVYTLAAGDAMVYDWTYAPGFDAQFIGCYEDRVARGRIFSTRIHDFGRSIKDCNDACDAAGFTLFGMQYGGECYCDQGDANYGLYGVSTNCKENGKGGKYAMAVYSVLGSGPSEI